MKYRARFFNESTGDRKTVKLGQHDVYYSAEYKALEKCPDGWQVISVWSYK